MYTEILLPSSHVKYCLCILVIGTYRMTVSVPTGQVVSSHLRALLRLQSGTMMTLHDRDKILMSGTLMTNLKKDLKGHHLDV